MLVSSALLRATRANSGLTCAESAKSLHVPVATWYGWEKGSSYIPAGLFELYLHITKQRIVKPHQQGLGKLSFRDQYPSARRIKEKRIYVKLSQAAAANLVRVDRSTWIRYEKAEAKMRRGLFMLFLLKCGWQLMDATPDDMKPETPEQKDARLNWEWHEKQQRLKAKQANTHQQTPKPYQPDPETQRRVLEAWADDDEPDILAKFGMSTAALIAEMQAEREARTQQAKPTTRLCIDLDRELGVIE